jgi:WD40 repeat protein
LAVMRVHEDWVNRAVFSPDGQWALMAGADGKARVYLVNPVDHVEFLITRVSCLQLTCEEKVVYLSGASLPTLRGDSGAGMGNRVGVCAVGGLKDKWI